MEKYFFYIWKTFANTVQKETSMFNMKKFIIAWSFITLCIITVSWLLRKKYPLLSISLSNEIMGCNIVVIKTANLIYQKRSLSKDILFTFSEIDTKFWKYGIEFVDKLLPCDRYLVFNNFEINFCSSSVILSGTIPR